MPLINIDLMEGHGPEVYEELIGRCTALYALAIDAPIQRFRTTITAFPPERWSLGGVAGAARVSPLVTIELMAGRPLELLHRLMADMSALVAEILAIELGEVRVLLREIPVTHWGIGGVPASQARSAEIAARAAAAAG